MAGFSTLRDNFTDNSISTSAWIEGETGSATAAETSGQIRFTLPSSTAGVHDARLTSRYTYDLTSDSFYLNVETMVATGVAATAFLQIYLDTNNRLIWSQTSGTIKARSIVAGVDTDLYSAAWSGTTYKYWRIRADTTTVYWDSSTNGTSWTNRASVAISSLFPITSLLITFGASCGNIASPGSFRLDDVNLILPALSTNWRYQWARWPLTNRHKRVTIAIDTANTVQGYLVTADGVDASGNPSGNVRYWSGPAGGGRLLTEQPDQTAAEAMAVNLPLNGSFDLPSQIDARYFRLYDRSIDGAAFTIREYFPRRLVQADDIEAESIQAINIAASAITVDKLDALLTITGKNIQTAYNGARVVMSGDDFGGLVTYDDTDTYDTTDGTGTYQILLSLNDGWLYAGSGQVILNEDGLSIEVGPSSVSQSEITWFNATDAGFSVTLGSTYDSGSGTASAYWIAEPNSGDNATITINANDSIGGLNAGLQVIGSDAAVRVNADTLEIPGGGIEVGSPAVGAGSGQIRTAGSIVIEDGGIQIGNLDDTSLSTALAHSSILRTASGTPLDGFGEDLFFSLHSGNNTIRSAVQLRSAWATAADATRKARMSLFVYDTAAREIMRGEASGSAAMIGLLGAAAVIRQTVGAAAPAGGVGTAAGGYDTAANRNAMITLLNNIRTAGINLGLWQT